MNALPDGWSVSEVAGELVIHWRPVGLYSAYVLSRTELLTFMQLIAEAVASADEGSGRTLELSLGSVDVGHALEGWAVFVENANVTLDVGPGNMDGHYVLNIEQASTLWRSLTSGYWLESDQIQEILWQAFFGDDGLQGDNL